jgi:replicative DNA helicase
MTGAPAHHLPAAGMDGLLGLAARLPPQSAAAERALLGALLANNSAFDRVADLVEADHFADPLHGAVFAAIRRRIELGQVADVVSLRAEFEHHGLMAEAPGGVGYLAELLGSMVGIINAREYARLIRDCWARRCVIDACSEAVNRAFHMDGFGGDAAEVIDDLDGTLSAIAQGQGAGALLGSDKVAESVVDQFFGAIARRGKLPGVPTGYPALDRKLGGLRPKRLYVLAARPSMGKTALGNAIAARAAASGFRTLFVSAEMGADDVMSRTIAALARLPLPALSSGGALEPGTNRFRPFDSDGPEVALVGNAARRAGMLPLRWDEAPGATVSAIRARARRMAREKGGGLDLLVVDYLGRCKGSAAVRRSGNRVAEVSEMVRDFKSLAVELKIPVLLLSQLSRESTKREDPRPQLSDLRDSGEIEQEADVVMFLHREHYYLERARPVQGKRQSAEEFEQTVQAWYARLDAMRTVAEIDVAKQRQGPIGTVRLRFEPTLTWFYDESEPGDGDAIPAADQA